MPGRRFDAFATGEVPERPADPAVRRQISAGSSGCSGRTARAWGRLRLIVLSAGSASSRRSSSAQCSNGDPVDPATGAGTVELGLLTALVGGMVGIAIVTGMLGV